ncbi:MAG: hypothetical protein WAO02_06910 [Verrucomicrobiia bacterium]
MSVHGHLPPVSSDERLARFVTVEKWLRADKTVRQDAFIPPKDLNLSVTRHLRLSQEQLWQIGQAVVDGLSAKHHATLFGRADLTVAAVTKTALRVDPAPILANPQHTHITGWPLDKPAQKNIAQQLAAAASFTPNPAASQR